MKKKNLDRLLHRYITGEVTEQEKIKIEAWLDVMKTDEGTNLVLDEADEERLFRKITSNINNVEEIKAFRPKQGGVHALFSTRWFQVAATLMFVVAASYMIWFMVGKPGIHETIAGQEIEKVILNDGTIVWLQAESSLTYDERAEGIRQASLEGEGLFEVAKDASRPFIISCGTVTVKVIGTSFNLKSAEQGVELKVLTGKVNLSSATDQSGIDVAPNEMVIYSNQGEVAKIAMNTDAVKAVTAHTEYNMEFKNTAMENVIQRIENKFDVDVVLENTHVNTCRITADFTDHSLESTLDMVTELLEIEYIIKRSNVTITGDGCE